MITLGKQKGKFFGFRKCQLELVVLPSTAEDLDKTGNDDEKTKSKNPTSVVKHHLVIKLVIEFKVLNVTKSFLTKMMLHI